MVVAASVSRQLEIRLLGEPGYYADGTFQDVKLPTKSFEVLCMLALHSSQRLDRAKLAFTLWPDDSEEDAKANLRRHIYLIRRVISRPGEQQLVATSSTVMWRPDGAVAIDVVEFLHLSEDPDSLERAAALYKGDLLASLYEDWLEEPRMRLRTKQLQNLLALSDRYVNFDPKRALDYAEMARRLEPWEEEALRCVMRARTKLGDRAGAVQTYRDFANRIHEEFGTEPAHETKQAFQDAKIAEARNNNIPLQLTSFVGREQVLAEIKPMIEESRLVMLVGAGGVGKTRCAIQLATELLEGYDDGVWLADLAPISDPSLVTSTIARALNVQESPNRPLLDTLLAYLRRKQLLLIVDNCEHVIDEARHVAAAVLRECPAVHIVATSREPLNISGEEVYRMPSLGVPSNAEIISTKGTSPYGAVQLFVDRAVSSDKRFALTDENAPHVAEVCRRLDGIPLAIELAAARVKVLSPQQLAQKLDERFRVLTGGDRSALPRHQTMRALIDWSYDLLSDDERRLFRKLSIFAGGFTLETAAVCSGSDVDKIFLLDLISSLVDKSLVQAEVRGDDTRYRLLESTRQYAREKLSDAGEEHMTAHAHAQAILALTEQFDEAWEAIPERVWLAQAEPELGNIRAALDWALAAEGDKLLGQRLSSASRRVWWYLAPAEGRRWVQAAHERTDGDTPAAVLAALDLAEAQFAGAFHQYKASLECGERELVRYYELANPLRIAEAERFVGFALTLLGKIGEGERYLHQALSAARALGARKLTSIVLRGLGNARAFSGDFPGAREFYSEALAAARSAHAELLAAVIAGNLAETEFRSGNTAAALRLESESFSVLSTRYPECWVRTG